MYVHYQRSSGTFGLVVLFQFFICISFICRLHALWLAIYLIDFALTKIGESLKDRHGTGHANKQGARRERFYEPINQEIEKCFCRSNSSPIVVFYAVSLRKRMVQKRYSLCDFYSTPH